ncbi:MAG: nucleoside recognition domain-containing protein [Alcanivoracaceae bacterium]|nr:nucleoside recognition domain-containing protein [Alcanivoracaceae bacterium]
MNRLFTGMILLALVAALGGTLFGGADLLTTTSSAMFRSAELAVEVSLGLIGVLTLWSGLFLVAERSGLTDRLARLLTPLMTRLMPGTASHPQSIGPVTLNMSANMLGLDNAATPLGLKAMESLERHNPRPGTASNDQIMFLVLNTSSVTLVPVTVFMYRAQQGAADPADIYLPLLMSTTVSTFFGVWFTARRQGISLRQPLIVAVALVWLALLGILAGAVSVLDSDRAAALSSLTGNGLLLAVVAAFLLAGLRAGQDVYSTFIEGAREGFHMAVRIIPYLVAMLVAIGMLRAAGVLDLLLEAIRTAVAFTGADTRFVDALPVAFLKPLSGSGARAMMLEVMQTHGVDSLAGRMAAVMQGSTETTFYVLAVYFGSTGINRVRHAISCGVAADLAGLVTAVLVSYLFFG